MFEAKSIDQDVDPRSVCNLMLDETLEPITNLALQKLLYFAHGIYLTEAKKPLVSGYFEAWQFGPVHPGAYEAFKTAGNRPIEFRAVRRDPLTGEATPIANPTNIRVINCVRRVILTFGNQTAGRLVEIAHAREAPWHHIVDKARTGVAFGMKIPDNVIAERFRHHKVSVGPEPRYGEPSDDAPFA